MMKEDFIGLKIGSAFVTAAQVSGKPEKGLRLEKIGWVERTRDQTAGPSSISDTKRLLKECPMHISTVVSNLRKASVIVRYFRYPMLSSNQLEDALRLEAEQLLLLPQDEICLDWHLNSQPSLVFSNGDGENGGEIEGILIAIPKEDMESELKVLRAASLFPLAMRPSSTAVANLYLAQMGTDMLKNGSTCLVHSTPSRTELVFMYSGPSLYFSTATTRSNNRQDAVTHINDAIRDALWYFQYNLKKPEVSTLAFSRGLALQNDLMQGCKTAFPEIKCEEWDPLDYMTINGVPNIDMVRQNPELQAEMVTCLGLALG